MKTISIFLASSEELDYYRMAFGNLVRRLDDIYERRGVRIKLFEWEDYDAAYNNCRKQTEYNDIARKSDLFIALFGIQANKFTLEEFDAALDEYGKRKAPKIYVYCMDIPEEEATDELKSFKKRLKDDLQYYWCRYNNRERLQFNFVMQLQLFVSGRMDEVKLEDGIVSIGGLTIANMNKLKFASANDDYQNMSKELENLSNEIKRYNKLRNKYPDVKDYELDLQNAKNKYNKLKDDFAMHQQLLFDTAKRVAQLQGKRITERMRRAMDALEDGEVRKANIILEDVEEDARRVFEEFKQSRKITEEKRQNIFLSIDELKLRASILIADSSIMRKKRLPIVEKDYVQADEMAQECNYDNEKYIRLLFDYVKFLFRYSSAEKALNIAKRLVQMCEETYDEKHEDVIDSYKTIVNIYLKLGEKTKAQEYLDKVKQ